MSSGRRRRHESPDSYTTPAWVEANGRAELIITGGDVVSGHDPETGREYWRADVLNPQRDGNYRIVASPTIVDGPDHRADTQQSDGRHSARRQWRRRCDSRRLAVAQGPDVPTPVSDGKLLYVVRDGGVVFALDVKTGATVYGPERLPPGPTARHPSSRMEKSM